MNNQLEQSTGNQSMLSSEYSTSETGRNYGQTKTNNDQDILMRNGQAQEYIYEARIDINNLNMAGKQNGYIGAYSPEQRKVRIQRFNEKRNRRVWTKKVKYDVRKNFADSRLRVKGRFVKKRTRN